jgi:hypothetical protein
MICEFMDNPPWRKPTASGSSNCVEVAASREAVHVRDSKHQDGPVLTFTPDEWLAFLKGVRAGEFDLRPAD